MRDKITFERVETPEQEQEFMKIAASMGQKPEAIQQHPIIMVRRGARCFGFMQFVNRPIANTTWNTDPKIASKRDVLEAMKTLIDWSRINGGCFTAAPLDEKKFTPKLLAKLGLVKMGVQLYNVKP